MARITAFRTSGIRFVFFLQRRRKKTSRVDIFLIAQILTPDKLLKNIWLSAGTMREHICPVQLDFSFLLYYCAVDGNDITFH